MEVQALTAAGQSGAAPSAGVDGLDAGDFLQLMITQLTNQDPLEPTDNQALLDQLSSIREIELSTSLTETLHALTGQQRYSAAAALIGKDVSGVSDDGTIGPQTVAGRVSSVSFDDAGAAMLHLDGGATLPMDSLRLVADPNANPELLVGKIVRGHDSAGADPSRVIEGIVTGLRIEDGGRSMLELDTGEELSMRDLIPVV